MKIAEILKRMFLERHCLICQEALPYDGSPPFCPDCVEYYQELMEIKCRNCGRKQSMCICLPSKINKISHSVASWSVFYDTDVSIQLSSLFSRLKHKYNREIIDFCTDKMVSSFRAICRARNINYKKFVVTYVTRRRESILKYGFDQSEKLAKSFAKKLGLQVIKVFENRGNEEQKSLNKKQRAENAAKSYVYIDGSLGEHKSVVLIDDIMTSGATLYACAFQLYKNGALNVIPVTFAKDNYKSKGVKGNVKRNSKYNFTGAVKGFVRNGSQR